MKVSLDAYRRPGVCWHCGAPNAPLRKVRLLKVSYLFQFITSEACEIPVPLCAAHARPNLLWHYLRILTLPLCVLVFTLVMVALPDEPEMHGLLAFGCALAPSVGFFAAAKFLMARKQTFWPHLFNVRTVEVCFNDPGRARAIAEDLATVQTAEPAPPPGERPAVEISHEEISLG